MKRKMMIALSSLLIFAFVSCKSNSPKQTVQKTTSPEAVEWVLFDTDARIDKEWESYRLLKEVSKETNIVPHLRIVRQKKNVEILKLLLSEDYPDLITLPLYDNNLLKIKVSMPLVFLTKQDSIFSEIPQHVRQLHAENNTLWYLPGGFSAETSPLTASEGIYIYKKAYEALGSPNINTFPQLISLIQNCSAASVSDVQEQILFDSIGHRTLEHLFGIDTQTRYQVRTDQPGSGSFAPLIDFLNRLKQEDISARTIDDFDAKAQPLIFIGQTDFVLRWNQLAGEQVYLPLTIRGTPNAFLSAYSQTGSYATVIHDGQHKQTAYALISYLYREEVSRKLMLGFENSHWLFDSSNQEPVVPKQQSEKMQQANAELLNHDGISVFPYLSSFGAIYPYVTEQMIPCRDLSAQDRTVWLSPFSPEGQHFAEIDAALEQYYTVLSQ